MEMSLSLEETKRPVSNFHHLSNGRNENSSYRLSMMKMSKQQETAETVHFFEEFYSMEELLIDIDGMKGLFFERIYTGAENEKPLNKEEFSAVCYLIENSVRR